MPRTGQLAVSASRRIVLAALLALLATAAGLLGPAASPGQAAARCYGDGCNAQDPQAMGCASDARVLAEFTYRSVRVKLNHSPACGAAWTKFENPLGGQPGQQFALLAVWDRQQGGSLITIMSVRVQTDTTAWLAGYTHMWTFSRFVQACLSNSSSSLTRQDLCTARY